MSEKRSSEALREFISETEEIVEALNLDLVTLAERLDSGEYDPDLINGIFRGAHSIKGLAGMFGFDDLSQLAHRMENLLDQLRLGKVPFNQGTIDALFGALETLSRLISGKSDDEHFTLDLTDCFERIEQATFGKAPGGDDPLAGLSLDPAILNVLTEYEEHRLLENIKKRRNIHLVKVDFDLSSFDQELAELTQQLKQLGEVISTLPCIGDIGDRISFQVLFGSERGPDDVRALLSRDGLDIRTFGGETGPAASPASAGMVIEEPPTVPARGEERLAETADAGSLRSISRTVRVDIDKLDLLMNIVGELVLSKGAIAGICDRLRSAGDRELAGELGKATRILERRLHDLQKGVMDVRMVPVGQLFEKMTRIVRRVSNEQGKKVDLDIRGADTELDKLIIEDVSDPLMHIIRNAIDHGLETPEERRAAGKPEKGTICLWAAQKGNHVVIEVRDDGRGIDPERVRRKAVARGLIGEGQELTRSEIYELLFLPGFSTRDEVSDLSGRGVGMDVVKNNITQLSGMVELASELGRGTSMTITLPITLAIIKALIVRVAGQTYAIPINSVQETLMIDGSQVRTIERREVLELRESTLPLLRLDRTFNLTAAERLESQRLFVAVVGLADKRLGFVVDDLLGQQDVVIKSLGKVLSFVKGVAGAAELGNQKTILVLDVAGLMGEALRGEAAGHV
ncbi:MAG: chemotaxis protein CheA [Deltaproteobacteria bacterium]|nr:MAG: chemotaxis protein CheA [Deltaproteobacteria bacterium]